MSSVSISAAKNNLSALIKRIRGGASVTITDRGIPVARLVPPVSTRGMPASAVDLAQRGIIVLPEREPVADWDKNLTRPRPKKGASLVNAVLDERDHGW